MCRKSNGFGRFNQTIVLRVTLDNCDAVSRRLGNAAAYEAHDSLAAKFTWKRSTHRLRDDEDVVFALSTALGDVVEQSNWWIDWAASEY